MRAAAARGLVAVKAGAFSAEPGQGVCARVCGGEVRVEDMTVPYWAKRFNGARRMTVD